MAKFETITLLGICLLLFHSESVECSGQQICYPRRNTVGHPINQLCYSDFPPFDDMPLPQHVDFISPSYHVVFLNTTTGQVTSIKLPIADAGLVIDPSTTPAGRGDNSEPTSNQEIVVIVHGWTGSWQNTGQWRDPIVQNLLRVKPKTQIIFVEWNTGAAIHFGAHPYAQPAANTRVVGDRLADFFLQSPALMEHGYNLSRVHCVGFSLGAHVCGFAAKRMWLERRLRWGRLTALDPALVYFDKDDRNARLSQDDADFVDVIHTSRMGLERYVGHIDFYPNPNLGKYQPGCSKWLARHRRNIFSKIIDSVESFAIEFISCSHTRAAHLFAESILTPCLVFCPCFSMADWQEGRCPQQCSRNESAILGYWSINDSSKRGLFFGETIDKRPYCNVAATTTTTT